MTKKRLSDLLIQKLKVEHRAQETFFDAALPGFGLRVTKRGTKSFVLMHGKDRKLSTIGRYPDVSLAEARRKAKQVLGEVLSRGDDPGSVSTLTFIEARERFLEDSRVRTKASTLEEYRRLLGKHFTFVKPLSAITRQDIAATVSMLSAKPSIEQHAFVAVRTMMNWCVRHGLIGASPVPPLRFSTTSDLPLRISSR